MMPAFQVNVIRCPEPLDAALYRGLHALQSAYVAANELTANVLRQLCAIFPV